jgi:hypothetical protein
MVNKPGMAGEAGFDYATIRASAEPLHLRKICRYKQTSNRSPTDGGRTGWNDMKNVTKPLINKPHLNKPLSAGPYKDRDIGCQEALEQSFNTLARTTPASQIIEAAGGTLPPLMIALAKQATTVGWSLEESEVAISELAQNFLDEASEEQE